MNQPTASPTQSRSILPLALSWGTVGFYILFTLLPNSNSLMVKWPWVFIWQVGLMLGPVLLLFQLWQKSARKLGSRLDWLATAWCVALPFSAAFAQFIHQAFWYAWVAICSISFLYVLTAWLTSSARIHRLLLFQGILVTVFSAFSLTSWFFQTVRPYLHTIEELKTYGIERSFDLQILTLRNWHPIGHQNYVAGYLVLSLPLLIGLAMSTQHLSRCFWFSSATLSLATLYSTASRASWLALAVSTATFIGLCMWLYPKLRKVLLGVSVASMLLFVIWGVSSPRIRGLFSALFNNGSQGELSYRAVTNATGWFMGLDHPILGAGLGGVTLLYQKYRPAWAGQEAELTYQLHSTPAQLWAELGAIGILLSLLSLFAIGYLAWRWCHAQAYNKTQSTQKPLAIVGIISGLVGYIAYAITDYQLDNICISGTLTIFVAILIAENKESQISGESLSESKAGHELNQSTVKRLTYFGSSLVIAVSIWLYPIHRAWMLSC
ncbi:MAG: O-antigen ligase family protein [Cyanobacteria bacterium J06560_5]